ncbi:formin-like protein 20 [Gigantopelta aegis]|uniref:formin-like protein 20 n=1 Tax=Gigantopelta aegis TaxID=1735272 RepID=UPI001B889887|nr:formin-like protein 20 [Gigantopelta aegis]
MKPPVKMFKGKSTDLPPSVLILRRVAQRTLDELVAILVPIYCNTTLPSTATLSPPCPTLYIYSCQPCDTVGRVQKPPTHPVPLPTSTRVSLATLLAEYSHPLTTLSHSLHLLVSALRHCWQSTATPSPPCPTLYIYSCQPCDTVGRVQKPPTHPVPLPTSTRVSLATLLAEYSHPLTTLSHSLHLLVSALRHCWQSTATPPPPCPTLYIYLCQPCNTVGRVQPPSPHPVPLSTSTRVSLATLLAEYRNPQSTLLHSLHILVSVLSGASQSFGIDLKMKFGKNVVQKD